MHGREDVGVGLQGGGDVGVAEPFLDDSRVDAVLERDGRPGVPQPVEGDVRQPVPLDRPLERLIRPLRVERSAIGRGEDKS